MNGKDKYPQCQIIEFKKCQTFYSNLIGGRTFCSLAKNNHHADYFNLTMKMYQNNKVNCRNLYENHRDECITYLYNNYNKCFMSKKFLDTNYTDEELKENKYFKNSCSNILSDECQEFYKKSK